jgi:hypothetical protein
MYFCIWHYLSELDFSICVLFLCRADITYYIWQTIVRETGGARILVAMLRSGPRNPVVVPTLRALGLLVSGYRAAQSEVGETGGCAAILGLLRGCSTTGGGEVRSPHLCPRQRPFPFPAILRNESVFTLCTNPSRTIIQLVIS